MQVEDVANPAPPRIPLLVQQDRSHQQSSYPEGSTP
jgi:hypothetical protein